MAKGSYDISVSRDSNLEEEDKINNENRECLNSCLSPAFLRSLSLRDRPRSSQVPSDKETLKSRYRALMSSSLAISSNSSPPSDAKSDSRTDHTSESVGMKADIEGTTQPSSSSDAHQQIGQNPPLESDSWLEDRCMRFSVESEKVLEKTIAILRTLSEDISESFADLTKPESIALEYIREIYKNKGKSTAGCTVSAEFDLPTESFSNPIYENWQPPLRQKPKDVQPHSTQQNPKNTSADSTLQSPKNTLADSTLQSPKNTLADSTLQNPKNTLADSTLQSPKNTLSDSPGKTLNKFESPLNLNLENTQSLTKPFSDNVPSFDHHTYENWLPSFQQGLKDVEVHSTSEIYENLHAHSTQQSPKVQSSPNILLAPSADETLNFEFVDSNSKDTVPNSNDVRSVEQDPKNLVSSSKKSSPDDKSRLDFDLPTDHEQFIRIIGAIQNRCLEYREMIQDVAFYALEECLNFSQGSLCRIRRIRNLRRQFESQKRNFRDFKILCCKSVVFGDYSRPIDEKVTELIQSFYLKLMQEENETFMARLEFGLKMGEMYAKMLKLENESKKVIISLEKEILYLKKTSVGFRV